MGNPHAVIEHPAPADVVRTLGPEIERDPRFPNRTNVEFVRAEGPSELTMRVWERGVGETLACGTGACAAAVAGVVHLRGPDRSALVWIGAAFVLYLATFLITGMVNVPLNDQLAAAGGVDQITDLAAIRERFEATWVRWNLIRAVTSTIGFGLLTWGLVLHGRGTG